MYNDLKNNNISSSRSIISPSLGEWEIVENDEGNLVGNVSISMNELMAHSVLHPLRRIALAYKSSYGVVSARISINNSRFALHEYDVLEGVVEDVSYIILNIKKLLIKNSENQEVEDPDFFFMTLDSSDREVKAGDFTSSQSNIEIVNKDLVICHLDFEASIKIEVLVVRGYGYVSEEENRYKYQNSLNEGFLFIGTIFSSVLSVSGRVEENTGAANKHDILHLNIVTDGRESPKNVFEESIKFYIKQLEGFVYEEEELNKTQDDSNVFMDNSIDILNLETRSINALKKTGILTIGALTQQTPAELLAGNTAFGKKSLQDVRVKLLKYDLYLKGDSKDNYQEKEEKC
ncbi:hypothetical protein AB836_02040 [Rickettsiales bacterium (ex Bugula neritina AB1)]|nr:hypothetical protein AB836_02040 [Rickettsiales bacterium (ex Bugula neritina AB1)]